MRPGRFDRTVVVDRPDVQGRAVILQVHTRMGSGGPFAAGAAHPGVRERVTALTDAEKGATWWYDAALGGGAYLDYCCYGTALAVWFFGRQPEYATAVRDLLQLEVMPVSARQRTAPFSASRRSSVPSLPRAITAPSPAESRPLGPS